ncbi:cytochrome b subunit of succinate dehydrogenase, Sdh3p [Linderina pennispora]|nr:cytochrome b subunit of succinate dehydrogenase, Sdh3p [Linderina pennispora]
MFSAITRTGAFSAARLPFNRAVAARSARAFIATPMRRNEEPQSVVAARAKQHRPISPHLNIYQPQMTWLLSGLNRLTAISVGGSAMLYSAAFGLAPALGMDLSSAAVASTLASYPALLLVAKAAISSCFSFHIFSGFRHLLWDTGRELTNQGVIKTGYATIAATAVATIYLTFF